MAGLREVAQRAGVSMAAASRALRNHPGVGAEAKARVLRAAREIGYEPNLAARSLRTRRTHSIGLVIPDIMNPFFSEVARGVGDVADQRGYSLLLGNSDGEVAKEEEFVNLLLRRKMDGLVFFAATNVSQHIDRVRAKGFPMVLIDRKVPGFDLVRTDNEKGGATATRHLIELGHTRIALISGRLDLGTRRDRYNGYREALIQAGIVPDPALVREGSVKSDHGYEAAQALLALPSPPTAIFAATDTIATGVLLALEERRCRVPEDVAVVGYDNTYLAMISRPRLTSVAQPKQQMGQWAATFLIDWIEQGRAEPHEPVEVVLEPRLVVRESTMGPVITGRAGRSVSDSDAVSSGHSTRGAHGS
jgi:DNA-binding LacI/PurR family transcriptional regulator